MRRWFAAFRSGERGLRRVLGALEADIMEALWDRGPATVSGLREWLAKGGRAPAYTTVMTVLARLARKGLVSRRRAGRGHAYAAAVSRREFVRAVARDVVDGLLDDFAGPALAHFQERLAADDPEGRRDLRERLARLAEPAGPEDKAAGPPDPPRRRRR